MIDEISHDVRIVLNRDKGLCEVQRFVSGRWQNEANFADHEDAMKYAMRIVGRALGVA